MGKKGTLEDCREWDTDSTVIVCKKIGKSGRETFAGSITAGGKPKDIDVGDWLEMINTQSGKRSEFGEVVFFLTPGMRIKPELDRKMRLWVWK